MSDVTFNYGVQSELKTFHPSPELVAQVEANMAALTGKGQPRVYFERIDYRTYKVNYGDDVDYYPLATWALNAIEQAALS